MCAVCQVVLEDDATVCPECGTVRPEPGPPDVVGVPLVKYARKRAEGPEQRAATLFRWIAEAHEKNFKIGWAYRKYESVYSCKVDAIVRNLLNSMPMGRQSDGDTTNRRHT